MKRMTGAIVSVIVAVATMVLGASTAHAATFKYRIVVTTCDVDGAGTDADVHARLGGPGGQITALTELNHSGDDREQGDTDVYTPTLNNVGRVLAITLEFNDHDGKYSDWCLDAITVFGSQGSSFHPFHDWLRVSGTYGFVAK